MRPFTGQDILGFLAQYGYTGNPDGLAQPFPVDYVSESDGVAYLDVSPEAVRKGEEVPDRPVRIRFRKISNRWELQSVAELATGVESKHRDRDPKTPKISPWPDKT